MELTQLSHATCILDYAGCRFLIDPVLYQKNTLEPIKGGLEVKNPLVALPLAEAWDRNIDAILLTHMHQDHFDPDILRHFGGDIPLICSADYGKRLTSLGFNNLKLIKESVGFNNIEVTLIKGRHGTGLIGKLMGNSYGVVLKAPKDKTVYITGDTVWCQSVEKTLETYSPDYVVAFAGAAMIMKQHITLDENDLRHIIEKAPSSKIIAIHMEAWNHCRLSRAQLKQAVVSENLLIPADGETLQLL